MNSKQRVINTIAFQNPDRIPVDVWALPAAFLRYGEPLKAILDDGRDIQTVDSFMDLSFDPRTYQLGKYFDQWGSEWTNVQAGIVGEVKNPVLQDDEKVCGYVPPIEVFQKGFDENIQRLHTNIAAVREKDRFVIGGWVSLFERMQFIRGTETLYCDIALESDEFFQIRDAVRAYWVAYLGRWLQQDVDAIAFGDDWGSQRATLISPQAWRKLFKPVYQELFDMVKKAGKYIFFHSDGYIMDFYPDFIEMGVSAINSQLWCMGVENVAKYAGQITFWGEISRQTILPNGTPQDVQNAADTMKQFLWKNGGLIGQSEVGKDVPLENIKTVMKAWN